MATVPFYRSGQAVRIPVSATSGATPFSLTGLLPAITDKSFMFVNPCPFDIRLEGSAVGGSFNQVSSSTGWLILARSVMGPFTSKNPDRLSVQAFSTPGIPTLPSDFTGCFLELVYGRGD